MNIELEDTKGVIRIRKSKKNRQHNGQKKKYKRTNNDLQNIHIKLKIEYYKHEHSFQNDHYPYSTNRFGDVMVRVFASSAVDHGFESWSGLVKVVLLGHIILIPT